MVYLLIHIQLTERMIMHRVKWLIYNTQKGYDEGWASNPARRLETCPMHIITKRLCGYNMPHTITELKEAVDKGYLHFWTRPDRPWRNKIYEANIFASEVKNFNESKIRECLSGQKKDLSKHGRGVRNLSL